MVVVANTQAARVPVLSLGRGVHVGRGLVDRGGLTQRLAPRPPPTGNIAWAKGDLFVLPATAAAVTHHCIGGEEDAAIYWVSDEPLLKYLGVSPCEKKFEPTLFTRERMLATVEELRHEPGVEHKNRLGKFPTPPSPHPPHAPTSEQPVR